jgi:uncharacterized membrane protein
MVREGYYSRGDRGRRAEFSYPTEPDLFKSHSVRAHSAGLLLMVFLLPLDRLWGVEVLLVLLLLTIPGLLLLRTVRIPGRVIADQPALVPCASIILLLFTGLALDLLGPLIAISAPLRTVPIVITIEAVCIVLLITSRNAGPEYDVAWQAPRHPGLMLMALLLPVIAAMGALRLNNGHGNTVAIVAVVLCIAVLIAVLLYASRLDESLLITALFCVSLALMLAFSLRGAFVYGFDISTEYQRAAMTTTQGVWHPTHQNDAYGALLSLTIMPTEMHFLTGISTLMLLKLVYPLFGALFTIEIFALARRVLSPTWAYAAASITIAQSGFASELPALARQEVAMALFGALVPVILYRPPKRAAQWVLTILLSLGMVVSHYSTTYVAIAIFGVAVAMQWLVSWFRNSARITGPIVLCFVASAAGALIWYGPVTESSSGLSAFTQSLSGQGLNLLPEQNSGESPLAAFLNSGQLTMPASKYQTEVHEEYVLENLPVTPLDDAGQARYNLRDAAIPEPPVRLSSLHSAFSLAALLAQEVLNLLGAIGAAILVFRRKSRFIARGIGLLALGAATFLILIRLSGTLATFYNAQRALLQALEVFSITFCWALQRLDRNRGRNIRSSALLLTAALLAAFVINTSTLMEALLGGKVMSNLANSGVDYSRFVRTPQELAAANWLGGQVRPTDYIYADRYAQLPLVAMTGLSSSVSENITPLTINQNAWVYASSTNTVDGVANVQFKDFLITYAFPAMFLNENFNLVYSDGASEVYHR